MRPIAARSSFTAPRRTWTTTSLFYSRRSGRGKRRRCARSPKFMKAWNISVWKRGLRAKSGASTCCSCRAAEKSESPLNSLSVSEHVAHYAKQDMESKRSVQARRQGQGRVKKRDLQGNDYAKRGRFVKFYRNSTTFERRYLAISVFRGYNKEKRNENYERLRQLFVHSSEGERLYAGGTLRINWA